MALVKRGIFIEHFEIANGLAEIKQLVKDFKTRYGLTIPSTVFGMEDTGYYCNHILKILEDLKANVVVGDPRHMKSAMGLIRGKTDKLDAKRIAQFLVANKENLNLLVLKRPLIDKLVRLSSLRNRLISTKIALKTPLKEESAFIDKSSSALNLHFCDGTINSLEKDVALLEDYIKKCWQEDERLARLMSIICSVPAIGPVTALQIILTTNEFKKITSARKFACYAGVAPFPYNSGSSVRQRTKVSNLANKKIKALLHNCAMNASRNDSEIRDYYLRKVNTEGKPKMSVLNAIRFKLISRIFTCVGQDRCFQKEYISICRQT